MGAISSLLRESQKLEAIISNHHNNTLHSLDIHRPLDKAAILGPLHLSMARYKAYWFLPGPIVAIIISRPSLVVRFLIKHCFPNEIANDSYHVTVEKRVRPR